MPPQFFDEMQQQVGNPQHPSNRRRLNDGLALSASSGSVATDPLVQDMLRFTLYRSQDTTALMNSCTFAILLSSEVAKQSLTEFLAAYDDKLNEQHHGDIAGARAKAKQEKRALAPHPWGAKKYCVFCCLLKAMKEAAQSPEEHHTKALDTLLDLPAEVLCREISSCGSKFKTPMDGRTWKFTLMPSAAMSTSTRDALSSLLTLQMEGIRFEPTREVQTDLESRLWKQLQKQTKP